VSASSSAALELCLKVLVRELAGDVNDAIELLVGGYLWKQRTVAASEENGAVGYLFRWISKGTHDAGEKMRRCSAHVVAGTALSRQPAVLERKETSILSSSQWPAVMEKSLQARRYGRWYCAWGSKGCVPGRGKFSYL
jgi:hypothetical protein